MISDTETYNYRETERDIQITYLILMMRDLLKGQIVLPGVEEDAMNPLMVEEDLQIQTADKE